MTPIDFLREFFLVVEFLFWVGLVYVSIFFPQVLPHFAGVAGGGGFSFVRGGEIKKTKKERKRRKKNEKKKGVSYFGAVDLESLPRGHEAVSPKKKEKEKGRVAEGEEEEGG